MLSDVNAGYLKSLEERIHGELFADALESADYLHSEGFKDAAAVIAGSTLELHLRQLCLKYNISLDFIDAKGDSRRKKAESLNTDLTNVNAYTKLDQKNVTAWLGLRNNAAHAEYEKYNAAQVGLFIMSIRDFINRVPA